MSLSSTSSLCHLASALTGLDMQVMQSSCNVKHKCWAGESEILVALDPLSSRLLRYISPAHHKAHIPIACIPSASSDYKCEKVMYCHAFSSSNGAAVVSEL